jgi:hypothetical protein
MSGSSATDSTRSEPTLDGQARFWLRLEGLAALIAAAAIYSRLGGDWIWFVPLLLVPDLSALGYLRSASLGAIVYNAFHNWAVGLAFLGVGLARDVAPVSIAGAILIGHTGMDRAAGYGLKLLSGFGETHLGHMGKARAGSGASDAAASAPTTLQRAAR